MNWLGVKGHGVKGQGYVGSYNKTGGHDICIVTQWVDYFPSNFTWLITMKEDELNTQWTFWNRARSGPCGLNWFGPDTVCQSTTNWSCCEMWPRRGSLMFLPYGPDGGKTKKQHMSQTTGEMWSKPVFRAWSLVCQTETIHGPDLAHI